MRRKLGFVLAMLHRPRLLVLDEPSTGVDPVSRVDLWRMTSQAAAAGTAVVMSTTYLDEAERASSILVLDRGRPLLAGTAEQVMSSLPGQLVATTTPTRPELAWRRGGVFHEWWPDGGAPGGARMIAADLEDVVIASTLRAPDGRLS
jgi:ABC-2 type transport system ATP-binding protein